MATGMIRNYDYDTEADVLEVDFGPRRPAWTVELTDNILLSIDRTTEQPVSLTLLDYSVMIQPGPFGSLSFPLHGLDPLPASERSLVLTILTHPPVSTWLSLSSVELLPTSPLPIVHVAYVPPDLKHLLPVAA
ncbi:MAG: DUF2283 domain-containing protein [Anaerolineae bacterium]|nr:DUF2283 domain-containing protein [Anaerolineae bacterium]